MGKYINVEKQLVKLYRLGLDNEEVIKLFLLTADTEDVEKVRHGKWRDYRRMGIDGTFHWFRQCSECLYEREDDNEDKDTPYCSNCGAKMDLEGDVE